MKIQEQAPKELIIQKISSTNNSISAVPIKEVRQSLAYCMITVGLRGNNFPMAEEKQILINFLLENYPDYSPGEIKFAFEKAMARKFGDTNVTCYENFSCEYLGRILHAYEQWEAEDMSHIPPECRRRTVSPETINAAYGRFLAGETELYSKSIYNTLSEYKMVPQLTLKLFKRAYQRQQAILTGFKHWQSKGLKALFEEQKALPNYDKS
jgi:hypothetical protein